MAVNAPTTAGPYFATGAISWSDLRETFRAQNPDGSFNNDNLPISSSDLYRVTTTTLTNPIVPDCTENRNNISPGVGVPETGTYPISRIRNAIKYYFITQTGNDLNLDLDSTPNYNSNLSRNIRKFLTINGNLGTFNTNAAGQFNAQSFNLTIRVANGANIFGFGGAAGFGQGRFNNNTSTNDNPQTAGSGQAGGDALNVNSASGNNNTVFLFPAANVYGGGGGGNGGAAFQTSSSSQYTNQGAAQGLNCPPPAGTPCSCLGSSAASCTATQRAAFSAYSVQTSANVGCNGSFGPNSCFCTNCVGQETTTSNNPGNFGTLGRGWNNLGGGLGNTGNGGVGGDWGQAGGPSGTGGAAGAAVSGGTAFTLTGTINNTTVRGTTI